MHQNGIFEERDVYLLEYGLRLIGLFEQYVFLEETHYRTNELREVLDEAAVKVGESQKYLDIVDGARCRPVCDHGNLCGIHGNIVWRNTITQELDLINMELVFF